MGSAGLVPGTKSTYCPDLVQYHTVCEMNYWRLARLLGGCYPERPQCGAWVTTDESVLEVSFLACYRYTAQVALVFRPKNKCTWQQHMVFLCHACHDVQLLECIRWQKTQAMRGKYAYPNRDMFQPDEKYQLNRYIGELLNHCDRPSPMVAH